MAPVSMLSSRTMSNTRLEHWRRRLASQRRRAAAGVALAAIAVGAGLWLDAGHSLPDFRQYTAGPERKAAFFEYVRPLVDAENKRILDTRERLLAIAAQGDPGWFDRRWLLRLAERYRIEDPNPADPGLVDRLLRRVDAVPMSLALAQAAKESGWGTSRFAREGNNLFGEWCYEPGCGIVPGARAEGRRHEVEAFLSPRRSVASYLHNINTHPRYAAFRRERAGLRETDAPLSGVVLAEQLSHYSERRNAYVEELKQLILANGLNTDSGNARY